MCRWRQVQHDFKKCGHSKRQPDVLLQCADPLCKFSTTHPENCGPNCTTTCWQYRQFPSQHNVLLDMKCDDCIRSENAAGQRRGTGS